MNELIDQLMPTLSPSEWLLACYLYRWTHGTDVIARSFQQLEMGTGLDKKTIIHARNVLSQKSVIAVHSGRNGGAANGHVASEYTWTWKI